MSLSMSDLVFLSENSYLKYLVKLQERKRTHPTKEVGGRHCHNSLTSPHQTNSIQTRHWRSPKQARERDRRRIEIREEKKGPHKRRRRVEEICKDRIKFGEFHRLYCQIRDNDKLFYEYTGMAPNTFDYILEAIREKCTRKTTNFMKPISVEERLIVTLRYLATGMAFRQLALLFRISKSAVSVIIIDICIAIWETLQVRHMSEPDAEKFYQISREFYEKLKFPHCIGSIDGKHIRVRCSPSPGSVYFKYKKFHSIVLMAVADTNQKFIKIDVGAYGKENDGGAFCNTPMFNSLENNHLNLPPGRALPNSEITAPFVFVGDQTFPLKPYLMRPYPKRQLQDAEKKTNFNYRLSRARMGVERVLAITAGKFPILLKAIETNIDNAIFIVKAICLMHNIITDLESHTFNDDEMRSNYLALHKVSSSRKTNRANTQALRVRDNFTNYFVNNPI